MPMEPREHRIPLDAAAALTRNFRARPDPGAVRAGTFHADQVRELVNQPGCVGFRIYTGRGPDGRLSFVLVGVDAQDRDMTSGVILNWQFPCPPFCDDGSALNS
ncbi:MAG: hypothetical protein ACT4PM_12720 [Gemmatimonadales bacterium]